jgi:hypothetical protein
MDEQAQGEQNPNEMHGEKARTEKVRTEKVRTEKARSDKARGEKTRKGPVVVDLGSQKDKYIKELKRGEGRLMRKVEITIDELASSEVISKNSQVVVVVVKEKRKSKTRGFPVLPVPFLRGIDD